MKKDINNQQYYQHWRKKRNKRRTNTKNTTTQQTKIPKECRNNTEKQQLRILWTTKLVTFT